MNKSEISELQKKTENVRCFCILAHVDHGKTTLADNLLTINDIISNRMSGKLRYMDSRQDEQERGITMKSSAISLVHHYRNDSFLINLIDSPGHVDFSTEVSTAVRLCDGAIILIDVCEGICPQTHAVLRQASQENLKLILVLNKIDRLIIELKMTPMEAYNHLFSILTQFNAIVAEQFTSLLCERSNQKHDERSRNNQNELNNNDSDSTETDDFNDEIDESKIYFSPKFNNVFFSSAIDGWGFGIHNFADIYSAKFGIKHETLLNTLWGDFYINSKTKRIMKGAQKNSSKPIFVQLILDTIWQVYDAFYTRRDQVMIDKILNSLNIKIPPRDLKYTDPKCPLNSLFTKWLPLSRNLLDMIVQVLPSPKDISNERVEQLMCNKLKPFRTFPKETQSLKDGNSFIQKLFNRQVVYSKQQNYFKPSS
jgi:ribosome assembly protein 1